MRFLIFSFFVTVFLLPTAWAGERTSIGGASSGRSAIGGSAIGGSKESMEPRRPTQGNNVAPATAFSMVYKKYKHAVGVVVMLGSYDEKEGRCFSYEPYASGTAWAIRPSWFATNAHITEPVKKSLKCGFDVFIALNETRDKRYRVVKAISHPRYEETKRNYDGKYSIDTPDVGLLKIEGAVSTVFPVARKVF